MIRICFVCLGNICRSPMAEFIMKDKLNKLGLGGKFYVTSRATSYEEEGSDMHYGAKKMLDSKNISYSKHSACRLEIDDLEKYDYFICMDHSNLRNASNILNDSGKVIKLLDRNIADPWYTGNFVDTYNDLDYGIDILISKLK